MASAFNPQHSKRPENVSIKPVIRELVRTQFHFPNVIVLVDKIITTSIEVPAEVPKRPTNNTRHASSEPGWAKDNGKERRRAYRLYLTDGEKTIQAILKRHLHVAVGRGEIREGSIIDLKDYTLARSRRLNGKKGEILHLRISDLSVIDHDGRNSQSGVESLRHKEQRTVTDKPGEVYDTASDRLNEDMVVVSPDRHAIVEGVGNLTDVESPPASLTTKKRKLTAAFDKTVARATSPSRTPHKQSSASVDPKPTTPTKRLRDLAESSPDRYTDPSPQISPLSAPSTRSQSLVEPAGPPLKRIRFAHSPASSSRQTPQLEGPSKLTITPLSQLTGAHASRNQLHTVLALITHVDPHTYKPPTLPHRKRDLRIRDASTSKNVLLSVFLDAETFQPPIGAVALFKDVMTHHWGGGNLKKWPWTVGSSDEGGLQTGQPEEEWCIVEPAGKVTGITKEHTDKIRGSFDAKNKRVN